MSPCLSSTSPLIVTTAQSASALSLELITTLLSSERAQTYHWPVNYYDGKCLCRENINSIRNHLSTRTTSSRKDILCKTVFARGYKQPLEINVADQAPFNRELWGRHWTLLSSGEIENFIPTAGMYEAVGESFNEKLLCDCLNKMRQSLPRDAMPQQLIESLLGFGKEYQKYGVKHFMLTNGDWLFVLCGGQLHHLTYPNTIGNQQSNNNIEVFCELDEINIDPTLFTKQKIYKTGDWLFCQAGELVTQGSNGCT